MAEAALKAGLPEDLASALEAQWHALRPWEEVPAVLGALRKTHKLGIVTNCSERLGRAAAERVGVPFDVIVTAERAGAYKPDPAPYRLALSDMGISAEEALFVAGSGFDLIGTARVGLDTYWHNRIGLPRPAGAAPPLRESRSLADLVKM